MEISVSVPVHLKPNKAGEFKLSITDELRLIAACGLEEENFNDRECRLFKRRFGDRWKAKVFGKQPKKIEISNEVWTLFGNFSKHHQWVPPTLKLVSDLWDDATMAEWSGILSEWDESEDDQIDLLYKLKKLKLEVNKLINRHGKDTKLCEFSE